MAAQLKQTREKRGATLAEAAVVINVNPRYVKALEEGDYDLLPTGLYGLNYLREYAAWLDLDYEKLLRQFKLEQKVYQSSEQHQLFSRQTVGRRYFVAGPNIVKYAAIALVALLSLVYLWFLLQNIFLPPKLIISSPAAKQSVVNRSRLVVSGQTDKETEVLINDRPALVSADGDFSEEVDLHSGVNTIVIVAAKGAKKQNVAVREVLFKDSPRP